MDLAQPLPPLFSFSNHSPVFKRPHHFQLSILRASRAKVSAFLPTWKASALIFRKLCLERHSLHGSGRFNSVLCFIYPQQQRLESAPPVSKEPAVSWALAQLPTCLFHSKEKIPQTGEEQQEKELKSCCAPVWAPQQRIPWGNQTLAKEAFTIKKISGSGRQVFHYCHTLCFLCSVLNKLVLFPRKWKRGWIS